MQGIMYFLFFLCLPAGIPVGALIELCGGHLGTSGDIGSGFAQIAMFGFGWLVASIGLAWYYKSFNWLWLFVINYILGVSVFFL